MKTNRLLFCAAASLTLAQAPSFAGNPNIDQHMFHGRREVQLIDESYLFNDLRRPPTQSQTVIIEAPQATMQAPPPMMIRPGQSNSPGIQILHNGLPDAGFQSNMSHATPGRLINNLPSASSTNMLAGRMLNQGKPQTAAKAATNSPLAAQVPAKPTSAPLTRVYDSQPVSSGSSTLNTTTSVKATLQRGSLLANQHH